MELTATRRAFLGGACALAVWPENLWGAGCVKMSNSRRSVWERPDGSATDCVMVRRLYLDLAGRIPTAAEAKDYIASENPDKLAALTERLMSTDDFVEYWTMRFCDILRVKSEFPINLWPNAVYVYHERIRSFVKSGETWEHFARALITSQGSNFRDAEVNFFRATDRRDPDGWAEAVAQTFLDIAPADLDRERRERYASYLSNVRIKTTREWKEEIVFSDGVDRRAQLCDRLFVHERSAVAAAFVQRVRKWIFGPSAPADTSREFRITGLRETVKDIVLSPEYRRGSVTGSFPVRRLDAEILDDVFCSLSGFKRNYQSPAPEPFTFLPKDRSTVRIEDGSISSGFLSLFGRPARDTGLMDERGSGVSAKQRLYFFNSGDIHRKLVRMVMPPSIRSDGTKDPSRKLSPDKRIDEIYWRILSRPPSEEERRVIVSMWRNRRGEGKKAKARFGEMMCDVSWCLVNTKEFLFRI